MNEFEQETHKRASQNKTRRAFELIKIKLVIYLLNEWSFRLIRPLFIVCNRLKPDKQFAVCTERVFWTLNRSVPTEVHYMEKNADILDDMGVSKLIYYQKFFQKWTILCQKFTLYFDGRLY